MLIFLAVCHALIVAGFMVRIVLREDVSPPARTAWFIVLIILPYAGSVIYFLFGEIDIGHRASQRYKAVFAEVKLLSKNGADQAQPVTAQINPNYQPAFDYAASVNGFPVVGGNTARLMPSEEHSLKEIVQDIDAATDYVHVLYYIWLDDTTGTAIAEALIRATERGVTCRAMADGLGSRPLIGSRLWKRMQAAGVHLAVALPLDNPIRTILTSRLDLRNHRKITVVDGRITYCGSRNSADPAFMPKPKFAPWVDIMLRFEGPVVAQNDQLFATDWMVATGENIAPVAPKNGRMPGGFPAVVVGDGPTERRGATPQLFANLIACARQTITITTPYFVPDATLLDALCSAAYRGVAVTLVFPARNDSWIVAAASRSYYRRLLEAGCQIYEYEGGLLHAKTLVMDEQITLIGSSNLDLRSFDLNYENNILLQDEATTKAVHDRQQYYLGSSYAVDLSDVSDWSRPRRAWYNVVATVGPIL